MSEEQGQRTDTAPAGVAEARADKRWGDPISEKRQQRLDARLRAWTQLSAEEQAERGGLFVAGEPLTGADVFYLAAWALAHRQAGPPSGWLTVEPA